MPLRQVQIPTSCLQIGMPQQNLNSTQIRAGFEQVGCEAMPEGLLILLMIRMQQRSVIAFIRSME